MKNFSDNPQKQINFCFIIHHPDRFAGKSAKTISKTAKMKKIAAGYPILLYHRRAHRAMRTVEIRIFRVEMQFLIELLSPNSDFRCIEHTLCATVKHNVYSPQVGIRISDIGIRFHDLTTSRPHDFT